MGVHWNNIGKDSEYISKTFCFLVNYRFYAFIVFLEITLVPKIANATTETELIGIRIAATTGVILPDNAKNNPKTL